MAGATRAAVEAMAMVVVVKVMAAVAMEAVVEAGKEAVAMAAMVEVVKAVGLTEAEASHMKRRAALATPNL